MTERHAKKFCPCGSNKLYMDCCGAYIEGEKNPATPEAPMRSRYTAYTMANVDYIEKTMRGRAAQDFDKQRALIWAQSVRWLGLEVVQAKTEGAKGLVKFQAYFLFNNKKESIHELSEFEQIEGRWYYTDGEQKKNPNQPEKIGRNDLCSCGSSKKYKKCCGN